MLNTKTLLKQIEPLTSGLPVYIIADFNGKPMKTVGLKSHNITDMVDDSKDEVKRALLLTTTNNIEHEIPTHADVECLRNCIKHSISNNCEEVHVLIEDIESSSPIERIITSDEMLILVISWLELLSTTATCK